MQMRGGWLDASDPDGTLEIGEQRWRVKNWSQRIWHEIAPSNGVGGVWRGSQSDKGLCSNTLRFINTISATTPAGVCNVKFQKGAAGKVTATRDIACDEELAFSTYRRKSAKMPRQHAAIGQHIEIGERVWRIADYLALDDEYVLSDMSSKRELREKLFSHKAPRWEWRG